MPNPPQKQSKYFPILLLLLLIVTLQSFLIGYDRKGASLVQPLVAHRMRFVSFPDPSPVAIHASPADEGPATQEEPALAPLPPSIVPEERSPAEPIGLALAPGPVLPALLPALSTTGITVHEPEQDLQGPGPLAQVTPGTTYTVRSGDSLWKIARAYHLRVTDLEEHNNLKSTVVKPGLVLRVPEVSFNGLVLLPQEGKFWMYQMHGGETLVDLAMKLEVPLIELVRENEIEDVYNIPPGHFLKVPVPPRIVDSNTEVDQAKGRKASGREKPRKPVYELPVPGKLKLNSRFGPRVHPLSDEVRFHTGIDIKAEAGQRIRASRSGRVVYSGWLRGYGRTIDIRHSDGLITRYAHCSKLLKKNGEKVSQNDIIAHVGSTGNTTGPHLHFEVRRNGRALNPMKYLAMARVKSS